ncbi:MAG: WbqC family protein [Bacteroidales bacterium]|nr:WbqC family protein [Bacteroidales bacterium]
MDISGKTILLSTTYLGPVEWYAWLVRSEQIVIDHEEHYIKQTYRNRCKIMAANGLLNLVIPVTKPNGNHTRIKDVFIDHSHKWQRNHWRSITSAYNNAPFYLYYKDEIESFFHKKIVSLAEFNLSLLKIILKLLDINKEIWFAKEYVRQTDSTITDLRNKVHPKKRSTGQFPSYTQVFEPAQPFAGNLSIIDLLFNEGPYAKEYLVALNLH